MSYSRGVNAIEVEGLGKRFDAHWAVRDLSFEVEVGEVFGLLGPNGAGKTSTLRVLAGLYRLDEGRAQVLGHALKAGQSGGRGLRAQIGLLTEGPGFYPRLSALYNLVHFGRLYGLTTREAEARALQLMGRFRLAEHRHKAVSQLSRGMRQKLALARALLHRPRLVLLDEPTVGLDPEATREVRELIAELASEGVTLVLCTHHLDEVERLCRRAAVVAGRLIALHSLAPQAGEGEALIFELAGAFTPGQLEAFRAGLPPGLRASSAGPQRLRVEAAGPDAIPEAFAAATAAGLRLLSAIPERTPLEQSYLELVRGAASEETP